MWRAAVCSALATLALAACGGEDLGASEGSPAESGDSGPTATEFLPMLLPEKTKSLEAVIRTVPECRGLKVEPSFVLLISDAASKVEGDTPVVELVEAEC